MNSQLDNIISDISDLSQAKTDKRMVLAAKLDQAIKDKGWSIEEFAKVVGKQPKLVWEWLSGTFNFDVDVLIEIEYWLGIRLIDVE